MLLQPAFCALEGEGLTNLDVLGRPGQLSAEQHKSWLIKRKSTSPSDTEIPFLHELWCVGAHLISSFARAVSSATAMVCAWSCWGWALLYYLLVSPFLLLCFTSDLGMPAALLAAAPSRLSLFSVIQAAVCTPTALTTRDGTECAKNRSSTTGRGIYSAYYT